MLPAHRRIHARLWKSLAILLPLLLLVAALVAPAARQVSPVKLDTRAGER